LKAIRIRAGDQAALHPTRSGPLQAGVGQDTAVHFVTSATGSTLKLQHGSDIVGSVDATATTGAKLMLDSANSNINNGAFDASQIGSK